MSSWDGTSYDAKDNLLRVVRGEAERFFALASAPDAWEAPTACGQWPVQDIVGHLIDVTESYFVGFDAARRWRQRAGRARPAGHGRAPRRGRQGRTAASARTRRWTGCGPTSPSSWRWSTRSGRTSGAASSCRTSTWARCRRSSTRPSSSWTTACTAWDIRQGTGRAHGLHGDAADLLVPFMFIVWQATAEVPADAEPERDRRAHHAAGTTPAPGGSAPARPASRYDAGDVDDLPAVLEFDPASFVLTAFGRSNSGTIRGDAAVAERYLNLFFRI